ncbi:MAG: hypothetical protein QOK42_638 [Frankiaceae bacterium]|nr:hypothetical protein [Frankiaceae bacterium]
MTVDRIASGTGRRARPPRRRLPVVVVLALVALGSAVALDRAQSHREDTALLRCVEHAQLQVSHALGVVGAVAQYSSPQLSSPQVTLAVRRSLRALVQQSAGQGVEPVEQQRAACARTSLRPWHRAQQRARAAYLAYLDGEREALAALARDFNAYGVSDAARSQRKAAARTALLQVLSGTRAERVAALLSP